MKIIIDGDACPSIPLIESKAKEFQVKVIIFCDIDHYITSDYSEVRVVDSGFQSVDMYIVNNLEKGDIVITQDYGLASLVLSRNSYAINQSGMVYTNENIDELLYSRYISKKMRNSGARIKGPKKRDKSQDIIFKENLEKLILNII